MSSELDRVLSPKEMLEQFPFCKDVEYPRCEGTFWMRPFAYEWYNKSRVGAIVVYAQTWRDEGYDNELYPAYDEKDDEGPIEVKFMIFNDPKTHTFHPSKQKDFDLAESLLDGENYGFVVKFEKNSKGRIVPVYMKVEDEMPHKLRITSYALGSEFSPDAIDAAIARNQEGKGK